MSSDKRDYKDFKKFDGKIIKEKGWYEFPTLYHTDSNDKKRKWTIFVRIVKKTKTEKKHNWSVLEENQIDLTDEHFTQTKLDDCEVGQTWVETGIVDMKISRHPPSYFDNILQGKANARSGFQQALIFARNEWMKKKQRGSSVNNKKKETGMYFPMLVHRYRDLAKNIQYPCWIQPKLDGNRCITYLKGNPEIGFDEDDVIMYSRQHKIYEGFKYIKKELFDTLFNYYEYDENTNESLYLDGEIYKHGKRLQHITSIARNIKKNNDSKSSDGMEYHLYDCFYPSNMNMIYDERKKILEKFYNKLPNEAKKWIKLTPTILAKDKKEQDNLFNKYLEKKFEGTIIRNKKSVYKGHPTKAANFTRSKEVLKRKPVYTMEVKVIGFKEGNKGKDKGAIIWIVELPNGKTLNVTPKLITYNERKRLFKDAQLNFGKYKNRNLTIEYEDLSKDGIPLRGKALEFRDFK